LLQVWGVCCWFFGVSLAQPRGSDCLRARRASHFCSRAKVTQKRFCVRFLFLCAWRGRLRTTYYWHLHARTRDSGCVVLVVFTTRVAIRFGKWNTRDTTCKQARSKKLRGSSELKRDNYPRTKEPQKQPIGLLAVLSKMQCAGVRKQSHTAKVNHPRNPPR